MVGWSIGNGVITMITPFLFQAISYGTLLLLFGLNIFCLPFVILLCPEISGRCLEEMDTFFENGKSWNVFNRRRHIKEQVIEDWRWTKKMKGVDFQELEKEEEMGAAEKRPVYSGSVYRYCEDQTLTHGCCNIE